MVSKEQMINGILVYADKEIIPYLPTAGKWGIGAIVVLAKNKADSVITNLMSNPIIKSMDIVNCDGMIDINMLFDALYDSASRYGKFDITLPMIGCLTFSADDVDKLKNYIIGG